MFEHAATAFKVGSLAVFAGLDEFQGDKEMGRCQQYAAFEGIGFLDCLT